VATLVVVLLISLGARLFDLGQPCSSPCRGSASHSLIFDEAYYVNAARVIVGIHPAAGLPYHTAPLHKDPNAEHPQLAKLMIAGGIELLGDNPWGWRIGSVIFGSIAFLVGAVISDREHSLWALGVLALSYPVFLLTKSRRA